MWAVNKVTPDIISVVYYTLTASRAPVGDFRCNPLWQWLKEGCRKPVLGVWVLALPRGIRNLWLHCLESLSYRELAFEADKKYRVNLEAAAPPWLHVAAGDCDRRLRAQAGKRTVWTVLGLRHSIHVRQEPGISTFFVCFCFCVVVVFVFFFLTARLQYVLPSSLISFVVVLYLVMLCRNFGLPVFIQSVTYKGPVVISCTTTASV